MPKKLNWEIVEKFVSQSEVNEYVRSTACCVTNSNVRKCTVCRSNNESHSMHQQYLDCADDVCGNNCSVRFQIANSYFFLDCCAFLTVFVRSSLYLFFKWMVLLDIHYKSLTKRNMQKIKTYSNRINTHNFT